RYTACAFIMLFVPSYFAGAKIVFIKSFRIVEAAGFNRLGQPAMNLFSFIWRQRSDQCLGNAIVIKLNAVARSPAAYKLRGPQRIQKLQRIAVHSRGT